MILFGLTKCTINKKQNRDENLKKIEVILSKHKKYAFFDFYNKSIKQEEKKYHLKKCDSLFDLSPNELYNENCIKVDFYSENHKSYDDENYDLLISKWLNKNYPPYMPLDNPNIKSTMTLKKALDFYESDELNKYIDSLRNLFYKKYENNNLKSINCFD
jgi:hypothetical protein